MEKMSNAFTLSQPNRKVHVGVILMNGTTEILDVAPIDLLSSISQQVRKLPDWLYPEGLKEQAIDIEFHWVNETGEPANLTSGLRVLPTNSFATCPPLDVAVMGAHNFGYEANERELDFIRKTYEHCSAFITICGGFQAAMQAGLFKGKSATAPAPMLDMLKGECPDVQWTERRWQRDGKLWTSGIQLNGLDLMRAFGEHTFGSEGTLMGHALELCAWPVRDVHYNDVKV